MQGTAHKTQQNQNNRRCTSSARAKEGARQRGASGNIMKCQLGSRRVRGERNYECNQRDSIVSCARREKGGKGCKERLTRHNRTKQSPLHLERASDRGSSTAGGIWEYHGMATGEQTREPREKIRVQPARLDRELRAKGKRGEGVQGTAHKTQQNQKIAAAPRARERQRELDDGGHQGTSWNGNWGADAWEERGTTSATR